MNNCNNQRKIVMVTGEDAQLIRLAEQVDLAAKLRSQADAPAGTINPLIVYETDVERAIIGKKMELERQYQLSHGLSLPPILVPADAKQSNQSTITGNSIKIYRQAPTDMEMAEIFINRVTVKRKGETIYFFDGRIYRELKEDQLHTLIFNTLRQEMSISGSSKQIKSVAAAIKAESRIEVKPEEMNVGGICLRNGILNFANFQLHEHSPKFFFTWMLDVNWLGEQPCPACDQFFEYAAGGDSILIQRFWEALAYALLPDYNAKRFLLLMGKGDTGKSVWGATVESFFEEDFVGSVDIFKFGDRFPIGTLVRKRVNISMDLSNAAMTEQAAAVIKQITGRDLILVEEKYKAPYTTRIDCKFIFGTNHALRTNSHDIAFLRRVLYLPFNHPVPYHAQNHNLRQILRAEKAGIFYKALMAYRGLVAKGYYFSGDDIYDFTKAYQVGEEVADTATDLDLFVATHCVGQADSFVATDVLFECYQNYCKNLGHDFIQNKQTFSTKFNALIQSVPNVKLCKKRVNGTPCNGYTGLALM